MTGKCSSKLPRHIIGAISVAIGFFGGITLLLVLPQKFGISPKITGFIALGVWIVSTWPFWWGGEEKAPKPPADPPGQE